MDFNNSHVSKEGNRYADAFANLGIANRLEFLGMIFYLQILSLITSEIIQASPSLGFVSRLEVVFLLHEF